MLDFVITPTFAEQVTFLGAGQVDAGLIPIPVSWRCSTQARR